MNGSVEAEVLEVVHAWDRAMVGNDPDAIGQFMADDWTIIGPDGSIGGRTNFLDLVGSGRLSHDVMESHDLNVRVYGDTAVVTGRGISGGHFLGEAFYLVERVSNVFVKPRAGWRCVLTHLSLIAQS